MKQRVYDFLAEYHIKGILSDDDINESKWWLDKYYQVYLEEYKKHKKEIFNTLIRNANDKYAIYGVLTLCDICFENDDIRALEFFTDSPEGREIFKQDIVGVVRKYVIYMLQSLKIAEIRGKMNKKDIGEFEDLIETMQSLRKSKLSQEEYLNTLRTYYLSMNNDIVV